MPRIAVDAMGADGAPRVEVEGVLAAARLRPIDVILVGDEPRLRAEIAHAGGQGASRIEVRHAPEVVTMDDAPSAPVRGKRQSSMRMCFDLLKAGEAAAVVSAGNSGAMMACGLFVLGRLPGVERPAIVTAFPTRTGQCALLDMGANVDPKPAVLAQFAVLGAVYARLQHGGTRPRVGLLSNGSEEQKGTALTRGAHQLLLRAAPGAVPPAAFDYVGYVEGRDIFKGEIDVVVTDGFTGNVVLKSMEGAAEVMQAMVREEVERGGWLGKLGALLMRPALVRFKRRVDWAETGGAPLLGVDGVVVIAHGGSNAKAFMNAVLGAERFVASGLGREAAAAVVAHEHLWASPPGGGETLQQSAQGAS